MLYWTPAEFKRFSQAIEDKPLIYLAFLTLYLSGCREGELLALRPEDIDFNLNVIRIRHSYARIKGEDVIGPPKTRASKRDSSCRASFVRSCVIICRHIPRSPLPTGSSPSRSTRCRMR